MSKKVVIIGASPNESRYSFMAAELLQQYDFEFIPVGIKRGQVLGKPILDIRSMPEIDNVDTITLYIRPGLQSVWMNYLIGLNPKRIIFNPGTENLEFENLANESGIETVEACTLVMLRTLQF